MPYISVIIPIYNVESYLSQCINSVLMQTFNDIEVILVNDGSTDGCGVLCDDYANQDKRVRVIHKRNGGLSDARNEGLLLAKGKYVIFLDADDFWEPEDSLSKCVLMLENVQNTEILIFDAYQYYEKESKKLFGDIQFERDKILNKSKSEVLDYMVSLNDVRISACTKVIKRDFLLVNDLFFKKGILSEDLEWFLRVLLVAEKYDYLNLPFYIYRKNRHGSITNTIGEINIMDMLNIIDSASNNIQKYDCDNKFHYNYLSYLAYQYTIALGFYGTIKNKTNQEIKQCLIHLSYLLEFHKYKKTMYIKYMYKICGIELTSQMLGYYLNAKKNV